MWPGPDAPMSVYAVHPGLVRTEFFRDFPRSQQWVISAVSWLVSKQPWYGAQTTIYCAVDGNVESETGKYYRWWWFVSVSFCHEFSSYTQQTCIVCNRCFSLCQSETGKNSFGFSNLCLGLSLKLVNLRCSSVSCSWRGKLRPDDATICLLTFYLVTSKLIALFAILVICLLFPVKDCHCRCRLWITFLPLYSCYWDVGLIQPSNQSISNV